MDDPASSFLFFFQEAQESFSIGWTLFEIGGMFFFVALNGFFVASEFALVSAKKTRIEAAASDGSKGAKAAIRLLANPTRFISAVQLGVTLSSLALGWLGEPVLAKILEPLAEKIASEGTAGYIAHIVAIVVSFAIVTFLHVTFGELIPKMFALEKAESFAIIAAGPLELFSKVFAPFIWIFNQAGSYVAKLIGLKSNLEHASVYTEDEIIQLVKLSQESGLLNQEEENLINKVFEFSDTTVKEAMIPRTEIVAIPFSSSLEDIAKAFRQYGYSRLPVYGEDLDDIKGVLHSKDVMQYFLVKSRLFKIEKVVKPPFYVVDTAKLEEVLRQMQKGKSHFGFVVDEHGGVEGIITLEDLLEEIVGDISDEHDEEVTEQIEPQEDGSFLLDGNLVVRDLNRRLSLNLPISEGYTTVAGFLMSEAGQILSVGETVESNGQVFTILEVEKRRILRVKMEKA